MRTLQTVTLLTTTISMGLIAGLLRRPVPPFQKSTHARGPTLRA